MENGENLLEDIAKLEDSAATQIPQNLEDYLLKVAKNGYTLYPWHSIKSLFKVKLEKVIADFAELSPVGNVPALPNVEEFKFEEMKTRIFELLESYTGVPFTIQRLCELLTQPYNNYKRIDKFLRGLERVMLVVSTVDPRPNQAGDMFNGSPLGAQESSSLLSVAGLVGPAAGLGGTVSGLVASAGLLGGPVTGLQTGPEAGEPVKPDISGMGGEPSKLVKSGDMDTGIRRLGDSLESPAKRMRLSIEEDGGPCDSVQDVNAPKPNLDSASPSLADSSPQVSTAASEDAMEIDAECTSSQPRLEINQGAEKDANGLASGASSEDVQQPEAAASSASMGDLSAAADQGAATTPGTEDETDSAAAAMDIECGAEEGISTSAESGPSQQQQQVETNSEAEASTAEPGEPAVPPTASDTTTKSNAVESSPEAEQSLKAESRVEEDVGVADSSDEAEQPRGSPPPAGQPGQPDQSAQPGQPDQSASSNSERGEVEDASSPDESTAEATAAAESNPTAAGEATDNDQAAGEAADNDQAAVADDKVSNNSPDQSI